jgi:type IV pilus assembly protein PilE
MQQLLGSRIHRSFGFSLIELMVTVALIAMLATIAVSSYSTQIQKSRRTEAKTAVLDLAGREERLFSTTNSYSNLEAFLGYAAAGAPTVMTNMAFGNGYYTLTVVVPDPAQAPVTPTTYLITATPVAGTSQANDTQCGNFTLNQLGVQGVSGTAAATPATCWGN